MLLRASALGIPVIASDAVGLRGVDGVAEVKAGDVEALIDAINSLERRDPNLPLFSSSMLSPNRERAT